MNYAPQKWGTCPATPGNPGYDPTNTTLNALWCVFKRNECITWFLWFKKTT
jgi:hypothetical protein